jgi:hypothetical protein
MSTPSIKVGQGNWGIKTGNLLGYANTDKKFVARDFTVGRLLNTATRVNASGNIEGVLANVPRIDYFGGQASLLVEPSAQNLALRSAELDNAVWTNALWGNWSNATATSSTTIAPDGSTNAEELTFTAGTSSRLQRITGIAASTTYTFSMYVMGKEGNNYQNGIFLRIATGFNNALVATSAATGRVDSTVSNTAWTRYSVTFTTPSSGVNEFNVGITVANSGTNPNATMICWGAQLETGSVSTSYIPTTTGSVTRNADVISLTGVAGLIGQTEGTIYAEVDFRTLGKSAASRVIELTDGTNANRIIIAFGNDTQLITRVTTATVEQASFATTVAFGVLKIAFAYSSLGCVLYVNSTNAQSNASATIPATNQVNLGFAGASLSSHLNDRIRAVSIYQTRLPNTTTDGSPSLQSITTL